MAPAPSSRRLDFRLTAADDLTFIAELHADLRVSRQLIDGVPDTIAKARIFLDWTQRFDPTGYGTWVVSRRADDKAAGLFSLIPFNDDPDVLELGGKMHPDHWGGRLAVEGGQALVRHAFETLDRDRLVSAIHPENRSAAGALRLLGFAAQGQSVVFGRPVMLMALHRSARRDSHSDYGDRAAVTAYMR